MQSVLPVRDDNGRIIGELRQLTVADAGDEALMAALTRWREARGEWFLTRFKPTVDRTRSWIANVVTADPTRLMYVVAEAAGTAVGTIGFLHLDDDPVEIDNILRGERLGDRDLMFHALRAALSWAFARRPIAGIELFVLSNNERACALYRRLGFVDRRRFALTREEHRGEVRFVRGAELTATPAEPHLLEMYLSRSAFSAKPS